MDNISVGQHIASIRKQKNKKSFEVANALGISESAYSRYERGETSITIDFINNVANYLEVSPNYLLGMDLKIEAHQSPNSQLFSANSSHVVNNVTPPELLATIVNNLKTNQEVNMQILHLLKKKNSK